MMKRLEFSCSVRSMAAILALALGLPLVSDLASAEETKRQSVVILNPENPTKSITIRELSQIFQGQTKFWGFRKPVEFVLPEEDTPEMKLVTEELFQMRSEKGVKRFYVSALFQQSIAEMPEVMSVEQAIAMVRADVGGIAIVPRSKARAADGVKVIEIRD